MNDLTQLNIYTPHRSSHRWIIGDDGLVDYRDNRVLPRFVYENFEIDFPMFTILRAEVCERVTVEGESRPYTWIQVERFDQ